MPRPDQHGLEYRRVVRAQQGGGADTNWKRHVEQFWIRIHRGAYPVGMGVSYPGRAGPDTGNDRGARVPKRGSSPSRLPFYYMMVGIGFVILAVNVMIAIVYWMFEDTPLVRQKQSVEIIRGVLTVAAFSLIMPIVWDPAAVFIENAAIFIMSPNGMHAGGRHGAGGAGGRGSQVAGIQD